MLPKWKGKTEAFDFVYNNLHKYLKDRGDTFITENPFFKNLQELNSVSIFLKNSNTEIFKKE